METTQANKALFTVMLVVLLSCAGIALPYPILAPLFLNEQTPLTTFASLPPKVLLGMVLAIYPLGVLIGSSVIGAASDIYGRKRVLLTSLTLSAIGYIFSAVALVQQNYLLFVLTRFLTGVCEGNISVAKAIAVDLSPVLDKTKTFSLINATGYAGWLLGPLAGGLLQPFGSDIAFWVAAIAILLSALCVLLMLAPDQPHIQTTPTKWTTLLHSQNSFGLLKNPDIRKIFYVYLCATLAVNAYYEFYPVWLVETFAFTSPQIGYITAVLTAMMVLTSVFLVSPIKRKIGLTTGSTIGMAALMMLLFAHPLMTASLVWLAYGAIGVAMAVYNGLLPVYISEHFNEEKQGQLLGLLTTTFYLANVIIAIVGSVIALISSLWSIVLGGFLMLLAIVGFSYFHRGQQQVLMPAATLTEKIIS